MVSPPAKTLRVAGILVAAFLVGAASAEVTVRATWPRPERAPEEEPVGDLVAFELRSEGVTIARSRLVSPAGKEAELVLRDPLDPDAVRLVLRVSTAREASGSVRVDYALRVPALDLVTSGRVSVRPGVEQVVALGPDLTALLVTLPVPSRAFDAWIEAERARRALRAS